jgi:hypothetical protein
VSGQLHILATLPLRKQSQIPLDGSLGDPTSSSERLVAKIISALSGIKPCWKQISDNNILAYQRESKKTVENIT